MTLQDPRFRMIQERLKALGYYDMVVDDEFGQGMALGIARLLSWAEQQRGIVPKPAPAPLYDFPKLPGRYSWLELEPYLPRHLQVALALYGVVEVPGAGNSPEIMRWRDELNAAGHKIVGYSADKVPWCGLFIRYVMHMAGRPGVDGPLWALNWSKWGKDGGQPELGDLLTFTRDGGGHVAFYIAEDAEGYFHVLGGNQSDKVSIMRIEKKRLHACRQPAYTDKPANVRPIIVSAAGTVSRNEA